MQADAFISPHLGASVLLNGLIFAHHIWGHLDADEKRQLRAVGRGVRALVDDLVVTVTMQAKSLAAADLGAALARWPNVQTLSADCDVHSAAVISAAPLSKLKALLLEHTGGDAEWIVSALSHTAAAGLERLHLVGQYPHPIVSIESVRDCTQLRKLSLKACKARTLGPLAGCVHLEELAASEVMGRDITPVGSCAKLKKLALWGDEVSDLTPLQGCVELQDLNISRCTQLVSLQGLEALSKLQCLYMYGCERVSSLEVLPACSELKHLNIGLCVSVANLSPLSACRQLEHLDIALCMGLTSLAPLSACANLKKLNMGYCTGVASVEPLAACARLEQLRIGGLTEPLPGMDALVTALPQLRIVRQ
ncbi:hypothetical protein FOA52_012755 [Chlamydomonas sp. UWO 241]|nr:hypothetical protein FOA52_012755 [Chlamydomonas sp. UWO 241]